MDYCNQTLIIYQIKNGIYDLHVTENVKKKKKKIFLFI